MTKEEIQQFIAIMKDVMIDYTPEEVEAEFGKHIISMCFPVFRSVAN